MFYLLVPRLLRISFDFRSSKPYISLFIFALYTKDHTPMKRKRSFANIYGVALSRCVFNLDALSTKTTQWITWNRLSVLKENGEKSIGNKKKRKWYNKGENTHKEIKWMKFVLKMEPVVLNMLSIFDSLAWNTYEASILVTYGVFLLIFFFVLSPKYSRIRREARDWNDTRAAYIKQSFYN